MDLKRHLKRYDSLTDDTASTSSSPWLPSSSSTTTTTTGSSSSGVTTLASSDSSAFTSTSSITSNVSKTRILDLKIQRPDKFRSVVIMHLSFMLDLNEVKYHGQLKKMAKQSIFSILRRAPKGIQVGSRPNQYSLPWVFMLLDYLGTVKNCRTEGIFRVSGSHERQKQLLALLDRGDRALTLDSDKYRVHDVATVLKTYLQELPEPLLLENHLNAYLLVAEVKDENKKIQCLQLLNQLLPDENAQIMYNLLALLNQISTQFEYNKMTSDNLAIIFAIILFIPSKLQPAEIVDKPERLRGVLRLMIDKSSIMFDYPMSWVPDAIHNANLILSPQLTDDVVTPSKRFKRSEDPDVPLKTTISFTDRAASARLEKTSMNTDLALNELIAHVYKLPESEDKRKFLKNLNSPLTPRSSKSTSSANTPLRKASYQTNLFGTRGKISLDYEDTENADPAIVCKSILLPDTEDME